MQATERVRDGLRAVIYTGTAAEVDRHLDRVRRSRELVGHDKPAPAGRGLWQVRVVLWATSQPVRVPRTALPAPPAPWRPARPAWLTPQVARWGAAVLVLLGGLTGLVWAVVQAYMAGERWVGQHPVLTGLLVAAATLCVIALLGWKLRRSDDSAAGCTTTTVHARRCRGHI